MKRSFNQLPLTLSVLLLAWCSIMHFTDQSKAQLVRTEFECRWAAGDITIDGKANEPAWTAAQRVDYFYLPWLGEKSRPAIAATRARLFWDREYLYFFAELDDSDLFADVKEHDGHTWDNGRGRTARCRAAPAQIRTCSITAYGSYFGCLA